MNFRSIAQFSDQILHWSRRLPQDIEAVVGVPRSGLLAANLLALYLDVPLTDVDGLLNGRCFGAGSSRRKRFLQEGAAAGAFLDTPRTVLVVDDSLWKGGTMRTVRERIEAASLPHRVLYSVVYVAPGKAALVDHYCEELNGPRVFEWNVLHGELLRQFCVALDGVLCRRPRREELDDEDRYRGFMLEARPYLFPSTEIGWLISDRPERYRPETEAWLEAHGIGYANLVMSDYLSPEHGRAQSAATFKADVYRSTDATLFLESSLRQAVEIGQLSRRPVLCTDSMQLVHPGTVPLPRPELLGDLHSPPTVRRAFRRLLRRARAALPRGPTKLSGAGSQNQG